MRSVYVVQDGASVRRRGELLQVYARGEHLEDIWLQDLEQLVLMGNIVLTPAALQLLLSKGVDTVFLSRSGAYRGRIVSGLSRQVHLRLSQYRVLSDPGRKLMLAKAYVQGKLANARIFLARYARRHGATDELRRALLALQAGLLHVQRARHLEELRGVEGAGAQAYFRVFGQLLRAEGFSFSGRNRRPPLDPVNALLSFGYTLLTNAMEGIVQIVGLDPYVGALHELEAGRPSLVCDLVEEFRVPVVDAIVVSLINRRVVRPKDFEELGEAEPVRMRRHAVAALVRAFETRMTQDVLYGPEGRRLTYRQVLEQQVRQFARFVLGRTDHYEPFVLP